jgi:hypothetical protein
MAAIFIVSCCLLGGTLWLALPTLDAYVALALLHARSFPKQSTRRDDRPKLRLPKSFAQLQGLNELLKKYRDIYPYRIVVCFVSTYLLCVFP